MVPWEFKHSFGNGKRILTGEEGSVEEGGPRRGERALECEPGPFGMECGWRVRQLEGWGGHIMLLLSIPVRRPFLRNVQPTRAAELGTHEGTLPGGSEFQWESSSA